MAYQDQLERFRSSYKAGRNAYHTQTDRAAFVIAITAGHYYLELLSHYTKWSFLPRIGISVAAILFAQYVAGRFPNRGQRKHVN